MIATPKYATNTPNPIATRNASERRASGRVERGNDLPRSLRGALITTPYDCKYIIEHAAARVQRAVLENQVAMTNLLRACFDFHTTIIDRGRQQCRGPTTSLTPIS